MINPKGGPVSRVLFPPCGGRRSFIWTSRCRLALPLYGKRPTRRSSGRSRSDPGRVRLGAPKREILHLGNPLRRPAAWSCRRWGFPCRRRHRRRGALLPHHFPCACAPNGHRLCIFWGTVPGVAGPHGRSLAYGSRSPVAVSHHRALSCSDFPPCRALHEAERPPEPPLGFTIYYLSGAISYSTTFALVLPSHVPRPFSEGCTTRLWRTAFGWHPQAQLGGGVPGLAHDHRQALRA